MPPLPLHRFRPRLVSSLKGYTRDRFFADAGAGLTVGIVALPLAMAFAIASGVKPEAGLFTAIIAGFLISALGGSNVQIGGPAGAFIVIVYGIVERYGLANLLIATVLAGVLLFLMGLLRLGALVRYVPVNIVIGFTNGIAVLIALSQVRDLLGLKVDKLPADFFAQLHTLGAALPSFNPHALVLGLLCFGGLMLWPRLFRRDVPPLVKAAGRLPGQIVALVTLTLAATLLALPVETIGSRFGGIPQGLPTFALPAFSWQTVQQLFIPTVTIALLGAVESLLCARVADSLGQSAFPRHDPNQELMAQGVANVVAPFFGGIPATGTIARTVTNLRAGATTPVAGMVHALALLTIVLLAAPLALYVPLAVLAGILLFVAWNMGEWHEFARLRQFSLGYRTTLLGTFVLTVVFDLTVAVEVGLVSACVFFIWRMGTLFRAQPLEVPVPGVVVLRLYGALFFGAVGKIEELENRVPAGTRAVVLEMQRLVSMDASGLDAMQQLHRVLQRRGVRLVLADLNEQPRSLVRRGGLEAALGAGGVADTLAEALAALAPAAGGPVNPATSAADRP
ncbi:SulP family inorganic anion transporter [Aquincola tertiaricarbonis]|uniref:SulP family inorganic anion transporter n=1 Tax=Aquincola tertiaricarbonis TaxID=391953 RepID=A0ABY4SE44_AQUTE|nr:SulP family inorganic anion transporter [Aquincola tertiaricarbonis]URI10855.1 SulP family inorganic anion transporter [Aquincola tertiaricarbonis]